MLRAVRFAATLGFTVEPATRDAIAAQASLAAHVSGERTFAELVRLLGADRPSIGLRLADETGLLAVVAPELARQWGIPQAKVPGEDLWDHTCRTVDAASAALVDGLPQARIAALLHDIGKPATFADGHFVGHDAVGAELATTWLEGLRAPRAPHDPRGPPRPPPHVRVFARRGPTPRSDASFGAWAWPTSTRFSTCGQPTTSGAGWRRTSTASRSSGHAAATRSRRTRVRPVRPRARRRRPHARPRDGTRAGRGPAPRRAAGAGPRRPDAQRTDAAPRRCAGDRGGRRPAGAGSGAPPESLGIPAGAGSGATAESLGAGPGPAGHRHP